MPLLLLPSRSVTVLNATGQSRCAYHWEIALQSDKRLAANIFLQIPRSDHRPLALGCFPVTFSLLHFSSTAIEEKKNATPFICLILITITNKRAHRWGTQSFYYAKTLAPDNPGEAGGMLSLTRSLKNEPLVTKYSIKKAYLVQAICCGNSMHIN